MQGFLLSLLGLLLIIERSFADENASIPSPDKHYVLAFTGPNAALPEAFTIQDAHGATIVSSRDVPRLRDIAEFRPDFASWSPDSQIVALAGGNGHDLTTFIFVRRGAAFTLVGVPDITGDHDNPYITPLKWLSGRRLVLDISGPHAGRSPGYRYTGRATIRISITPPACEVLYKQIGEHYYTDKDA
jgi:hypothetical protein